MKSIRRYYDNLDDLFLSFCGKKRVLDIGMGQHIIEATERERWKHAKIVKIADYTLGIDINEKLIDHIKSKGYNVRAVDATSEEDVGERFDVVFMGDVIEHVNNPDALLLFAKRHLSPGGKMLVSTPNPLYIRYIVKNVRDSMSTPNFDHTCYITPANMNELCRRSGLALTHYYITKSDRAAGSAVRKMEGLIPLGELYTDTFVYEMECL
jgi:2-polyprenyl-3-methyl-5-hydroxy-6-metoxy-1,4-benzoquinol methylase